jgi:hypothetical protein
LVDVVENKLSGENKFYHASTFLVCVAHVLIST